MYASISNNEDLFTYGIASWITTVSTQNRYTPSEEIKLVRSRFHMEKMRLTPRDLTELRIEPTTTITAKTNVLHRSATSLSTSHFIGKLNYPSCIMSFPSVMEDIARVILKIMEASSINLLWWFLDLVTIPNLLLIQVLP